MKNIPPPLDIVEQTGYSEQKTTTVILHEPLSFKAIPFKDGYRIEFSVKLNWDKVDSMNKKDEPIIQGIRNMIDIIEKELKSKVLDIERDDKS